MPIDLPIPAHARRRVQRRWAVMLAIGCFWFAALALVRPGRMAAMLRSETWLVRALGARDLISGVALLASTNPVPALVTRVVFDVGDAATFARRRPSMSAVALAYAALGVMALRSGRA